VPEVKRSRKGRAPDPQRRGTSTRSRRVGQDRGKEQRTIATLRPSCPPETRKSICATCGTQYFGMCPMNLIPKRYDIVVFVHECDQWRPK
jgi:hypothetical protein